MTPILSLMTTCILYNFYTTFPRRIAILYRAIYLNKLQSETRFTFGRTGPTWDIQLQIHHVPLLKLQQLIKEPRSHNLSQIVCTAPLLQVLTCHNFTREACSELACLPSRVTLSFVCEPVLYIPPMVFSQLCMFLFWSQTQITRIIEPN